MNATTPLVSVILPTYNRGHMIASAIESVLSQSYENWELLIIDDGSKDNTQQIVAPYVDSDKRVSYFFQQNKGAGGARNAGLKLAKGEYVTFIDSDDRYLEHKIEKQLDLIRKDSEIKVVLCQCRIVRDGLTIEIKKPRRALHLHDEILSGVPGIYAQTPLLFLERKFLIERQIYFDESLPAMEDWDFLVSASRYTNNDVVHEILYEMVMHDEEHVHIRNNIVAARLMIHKKNSDFFKVHAKIGRQWLKKSLKYYVYFDLHEHRELLLASYPKGIRLSVIKLFLSHIPGNMFLRRLFCYLIA